MTLLSNHCLGLWWAGYLVFDERMDQGAIDVVDGDAERHNDNILDHSISERTEAS